MRKYLFWVLLPFLAGCSSTIGTNVAPPPKPYKEVYYRFEKGLFLPNRYYLTVVNHSEKTVVFFTMGDVNFVTMDNGNDIPLVHPRGSWDFMDKGMFWVGPGGKASLSFDIPRDAMRQAVTMTFKGQTQILNHDSINYWQADQQLIVTYDVRTTKFSVKEGPLPVNNNVPKLFDSPQGDPFAPVNKEQFKLRAQVQPEARIPGKNLFTPLDR